MAKSQVSIPGKLSLVTGAGSGIGRATALALAERGAKVIACDINEEAAKQTAAQIGGGAEAYAVDVADREQMRALAETVTRDHGVLDILVNNAGVAIAASFLDTELTDWDWLLGINLMGVVHGCHFFVPTMVERGTGGHIINVSSVAGYLGTSRLNAYCTSKYAVLGFSESLRDELEPHHIGVSAICPGVINTSIPANMRARGSGDIEADRQRAVELYKKRNYGPEKVASAIVGCIDNNTDVRPVTPEAWAIYALKRISPRLMRTVLSPIISRM